MDGWIIGGILALEGRSGSITEEGGTVEVGVWMGVKVLGGRRGGGITGLWLGRGCLGGLLVVVVEGVMMGGEVGVDGGGIGLRARG